MSFSRDDLVAYEKSALSAPPAVAPAPPDGDTPPEAAPAPSAGAADDSDPDVPGSDATSADTADSATADAAPDGDPNSEPPPARSRARERIEDLVTERNALRTYGEHLQKLNAELQVKLGGPAVASAASVTPTPPVTAVTKDDAPPTLEEHNFDPVEYGKAQSSWLERQVDKRVEAALTKKQVQTALVEAKAKFDERSAAFAEKHPDYAAVVSNPALPQFTRDIARLIVTAENGPAINYHLATHPDLAARIARMGPEMQAMKIGEVGALIATPTPQPTPSTAGTKTTKQKSVTNAPPPPAPIPAGAAAQRDPSTMSMNEWVDAERGRKITERQQRQKLRASMR